LEGFVDGQLEESESAPTSYTWKKGSGLKIGGYSSNNGLDGEMDEFRIYDRALTQSEIQSTINTSLGGSALCESPRTKVDAVVNHVEDIKVITPIPYRDSANTKDYENNYSGPPSQNDITDPYLDGADVVYGFTPDSSAV